VTTVAAGPIGVNVGDANNADLDPFSTKSIGNMDSRSDHGSLPGPFIRARIEIPLDPDAHG
jgi:hypothetical protein